MTAENIVVNIMLAIASIGLLFMVVIFNTELPPLLKAYEKKRDKAFAVAVFIFTDSLLLCALVLVIYGIIGKL